MRPIRIKPQTEPVLSPFGQIGVNVQYPDIQGNYENVIRLKRTQTEFPTLINDMVSFIFNSTTPVVEKFLLIMLLRNGLRVSEICRPQTFLPIDSERFVLWSPKQRCYKECHFYEFSGQKWPSSAIDTVRYWHRSRQHYYRILNEIVPNIPCHRAKNNAVTHAARNLVAQNAFQLSNSLDDVMEAIGVVSRSAALRYLTPNQALEVFKSSY